MHELIDSWRWEPVEMSEAQVARVLSLVRECLIPEAEGVLERVPERSRAPAALGVEDSRV